MTQISNPVDKAAIKKMLGEISNSYTRIAAERSLIKETVSDLAEKYDLPKKTLNKMAKIFHRQSFLVEQEENNEFEVLYEDIVENTN